MRLLFAAGALIGYFAGYSSASDGDSDAAVADFERCLKDYIRAASHQSLARIPGTDATAYSVRITAPAELQAEAERLADATRRLNYHNEERATAVINQTAAEYNFARSRRDGDLRVHSDSSLRALQSEWKITNTSAAVWRGVWVGFLSGAAAWLVGWIVIVVLAFIWWFFIDRVRDIATAIRGHL